MDPVDDLIAKHDADDETMTLLREWFRWWHLTDDAPAKMPGALHVRTAMHLQLTDLGHIKG